MLLGVVEVDFLVVVELEGFSVVVLVDVVFDLEVVVGLSVEVLVELVGVVLLELSVVDVPAEKFVSQPSCAEVAVTLSTRHDIQTYS